MRLSLLAMPRLNHMLAGAAVLLGALAVYPWLVPISTPDSSAGTGETPRAVPDIGALPPLASFAAVFERPLFSPSRRPSLTEQPASAGNSSVGRYKLLGVMSAAGTRRALIADGNRRFEVTEGALLDGWTVTHIEQDRLALSSPSGQMVLKLRRAGEAPAEPPPSATPVR